MIFRPLAFFVAIVVFASFSSHLESRPGKRLKKMMEDTNYPVLEELEQAPQQPDSSTQFQTSSYVAEPAKPDHPIPGTYMDDNGRAVYKKVPEIDLGDMQCHLIRSDTPPTFSFKGLDVYMSIEDFVAAARKAGGKYDPEEVRKFNKGNECFDPWKYNVSRPDGGFVGGKRETLTACSEEVHPGQQSYWYRDRQAQRPTYVKVIDPDYRNTNTQKTDTNRRASAKFMDFTDLTVAGLKVSEVSYTSSYRTFNANDQKNYPGHEQHECGVTIELKILKSNAADYDALRSALIRKFGEYTDENSQRWNVVVPSLPSYYYVQIPMQEGLALYNSGNHADGWITLRMMLSSTSYVKVETTVDLDDF